MAGRPSNASKKAVSDEVKIETKQEIKTPEFDIKSLIQQVTQEVSEKLKNEYEGKITELENKLLKANEKSVEVPNVENKVKSTKSKFKFIPDNTKVRLKSNIGGLFTFNEDRGKIRSYFQIDNFGQGVTISFEELNLFLSSKPTFIKSGAIAIVDAYSDIDIEVEDIIRDLRLDDLYFNDKKINPMRIEDLFDDKITSEKEFADKLNNSIEMAETILEASYVLYRKGLFVNNTKMNTLRVIFNRPNLFK